MQFPGASNSSKGVKGRNENPTVESHAVGHLEWNSDLQLKDKGRLR